MLRHALCALALSALAVPTVCAASTPAPTPRTDPPPAEIAALTLPSGPLAAVAVNSNGTGVVLSQDRQKRITGGGGGPVIEVTYLQSYADAGPGGPTYRVVRSRLDCGARTARDIGSRLFGEDGAPMGWLPPGGLFPAIDLGSLALMLTQVCDGAPPLKMLGGPAEALAETRRILATAQNFVANPLPTGQIAIQSNSTARFMVVLDGQTRSGTAVDFWVLMVRPDGAAHDAGASLVVRRIHVDCAAITLRTIGGAGYDDAGIPRVLVAANAAPVTLVRDDHWTPLISLICDGAPPMRTITGYREAMALH